MSVMTTPKKKAGRPPKFPKAEGAKRSKRTFNVTISPPMAAVLQAYRDAQEHHVERSDVIEKALEHYFAEKGFWPPAADKQ